MEKLQEYQGTLGRLHSFRDELRERYHSWREDRLSGGTKQPPAREDQPEDQYSHIFKKKTAGELLRISAVVMGIEFSYAAETAFVSPTLLTIGVDHTRMTMMWALSPIIGLFLTPVLGSLSDNCHLSLGRRRPFIILLSLGILFGLVLVPNGREIGIKLGDNYQLNNSSHESRTNSTDDTTPISNPKHPWGVLFTVLGTILLDFDADACQSPARAYLLDVTLPEDHARGLTMFTLMAGLGGFFGYALGGINWDQTFIGDLMGGHVKAVFTLITLIFITCVVITLTSFSEIPLKILDKTNSFYMKRNLQTEEAEISRNAESYGTIKTPTTNVMMNETQFHTDVKGVQIEKGINSGIEEHKIIKTTESDLTLTDYLMSIVHMPRSILILCLTNLFCWMAHVSYSLNFTDYVGESVFGGNPMALEGSQEKLIYEEGVRFGCWGMSMYSLSCCGYSLIIEKLIKKYKVKMTYIGGLCFYGLGMILMAVTNCKFSVIFFSCTAGVLYSTLFTMPYLLIAHYHLKKMFDSEGNIYQNRGLGTDVAIVSSMVFVAQFTLSMFIGYFVSVANTTAVTVYASGVLGLLASISATQILYLDL
ncbi:proton-associated sugar transporter A [Cimex lectularius]|uniref:Proton-associated sugar transporter A n=1 Tax=Cimex lectularius TaxID=79782 RepID=A0A8I6TEK7_CIMLE|nr:proton-associated sugar transporter A [Cimex lectularius]XP_014244221.1 proton-associated sugar transporter A [Cimex lectularius]XP_014244222.1 proton-associated sugar transporter A [Cimex lectularius]XP_014244223.1 proton-associated sugar transporter A [Cimex lectularius]